MPHSVYSDVIACIKDGESKPMPNDNKRKKKKNESIQFISNICSIEITQLFVQAVNSLGIWLEWSVDWIMIYPLSFRK